MKHQDDLRGERTASEIRTGEMEQIKGRISKGEKVKFFQCSNCHRLFEEKSLHCPICNTRTMGYLRPI